MAKKFKIMVPKPASANELESEGQWQDDVMQTFVENGWAMEVKMDSADEVVEVEADVEPVRARNEKGQLIGDDLSTPDVNEAWEGGEAPKAKAKKKTTKKTTKKAK